MLNNCEAESKVAEINVRNKQGKTKRSWELCRAVQETLKQNQQPVNENAGEWSCVTADYNA